MSGSFAVRAGTVSTFFVLFVSSVLRTSLISVRPTGTCSVTGVQCASEETSWSNCGQRTLESALCVWCSAPSPLRMDHLTKKKAKRRHEDNSVAAASPAAQSPHHKHHAKIQNVGQKLNGHAPSAPTPRHAQLQKQRMELPIYAGMRSRHLDWRAPADSRQCARSSLLSSRLARRWSS